MRTVAGLVAVRTGISPKVLLVWKKGFWFFPGGKQEGHESLCETLSRELYEELRLGIAAVPVHIHEGVFDAPCGERFLFHTFAVDAAHLVGVPRLNCKDSVKEFSWVDDPLGVNLTTHARFVISEFFPQLRG